jgi:Protein of unknown function (DUF3592)
LGRVESICMTFAMKLFGGGIVALAFSLWLILSNWHDIKGAYFSDPVSFSSTAGRIVSSSTYTSTPKRTTYYHYSIEYEFTTNGKNYRSDEITFDNNYRLEQKFAQVYVSKYPVGKKVTVYYDPRDPSFSVLEPEEKGDAAVELLFLIISALVIVLSGEYLLIRRIFLSKKLSPKW